MQRSRTVADRRMVLSARTTKFHSSGSARHHPWHSQANALVKLTLISVQHPWNSMVQVTPLWRSWVSLTSQRKLASHSIFLSRSNWTIKQLSSCDGTASKTRLKHIDTRQEWIRMLRNKNLVIARHVPSEENLADSFTKILPRPTFVKLRDQVLKTRPSKDRSK